MSDLLVPNLDDVPEDEDAEPLDAGVEHLAPPEDTPDPNEGDQ